MTNTLKLFAPAMMIATLSACAPAPRGPAEVIPQEDSHTHGNAWRAYTGHGTEPFWSLELNGETITFEHVGIVHLSAPQPEPIAVAGGHRFNSTASVMSQDGPSSFSTEVTVEVAHEVCNDGMSDQAYPDAVIVSYADMRYRGCGGSPADLLTGDEWTVTRIGDVPVDADPPITIAFFSDSAVSGSGGCNQYTSTYTLGEGLNFGPVASTRRACPEPIGGNEQEFFEVLDNAIYFRIAPDGALLIHTEDGTAALEAQR